MMTPELTDEQRRRVERAREGVPFLKLLGIEVESVGLGTATLVVPINCRPSPKPDASAV